MAGHLKLGRLIYLYDDNQISIDGSTSLAFTEDRAKRFEAYHWHVQTVEDANDLAAIENAIKARRPTRAPRSSASNRSLATAAPTRRAPRKPTANRSASKR